MKAAERILIVEDDEGIRQALQDALELEGYLVETAADGRQALEQLQTTPYPALILLDLMLPFVTGWQVIEEVKRDKNHPVSKIPIVIASAAGDAALKAASQVEGYLKKPIHLDVLLKTVARYCGPARP